jgi:sulfane dehydrogenase subunit SoxC
MERQRGVQTMKDKSNEHAKQNASHGHLRGRRRFLAATTAMAATVAGGLTDLWGDEGREPGAPLGPYGERSPFEKPARKNSRPGQLPGTGSTLTPLESLYGIITPSALHFERHHSGVPMIDPDKHELLIHGLVEKPLVFRMEEIKRFPSVSRIHFLECSGNSAGEYQANLAPTPQQTAGLLSCSEWTGVALSTLLREAGVKPSAKWVLAEGGDASRNARSIPLEKAMDDVLVAYGQNGEAVRPEQGYPIRLIVPGWEGNINVKWVQRLHVLDQPAMTRDEAADYDDLLPNGKSYRFSFVMEAKSIVTRPAGGQHLAGPGPYEITGLAWSGRARVATVEVSTDAGKNWGKAELQQPVLKNAVVRFRLPWNWNGNEAVIGSRCIDESGYVQPTHEQIIAARGKFARFHYNGIKWWRLQKSGELTNA